MATDMQHCYRNVDSWFSKNGGLIYKIFIERVVVINQVADILAKKSMNLNTSEKRIWIDLPEEVTKRLDQDKLGLRWPWGKDDALSFNYYLQLRQIQCFS